MGKIPRGRSASLLTIEPGPPPGDLEPPGFICLHLCGYPGPRHLGGGTQARELKVQSLRSHDQRGRWVQRNNCDSPRTHQIPQTPSRAFLPKTCSSLQKARQRWPRPGKQILWLCPYSAGVSSGVRIIKWKFVVGSPVPAGGVGGRNHERKGERIGGVRAPKTTTPFCRGGRVRISLATPQRSPGGTQAGWRSLSGGWDHLRVLSPGPSR